jgi:dTDP-4-dehydrorhamnose reductase
LVLFWTSKKIRLESIKYKTLQNLLLTGSAGFLGTHFHDQLKNEYHIIGIYNTTKNNLINENYQLDITNTIALKTIVEKIKPNIIVHTAAISNIAECEKKEVTSYAVNVTASVQLARLAKQSNATFIFCSTDLVFDGTKGNYKETDLPNPLNIYGAQKFEAEQKIIAANKNSIIVRLPLMLGVNYYRTSGIVAEMQQKNIFQSTMHLFTNEYRSAALVEDVITGFKIILNNKTAGIFHIAGVTKLNRLQIAEYIKQKYKLDNLTLIATTHLQQNITNRPQDVSLNIEKMSALGYNPTLFI